MAQQIIRRPIHPEIRVIDEEQGTVEYIASDESIDSFHEMIRSKGWRFTHFEKNAPFVDGHRYSSVEDLLGRVIDFKVSKGRLLETVKWAIDVEDNRLAKLGFEMTKAGYAKAVSVGFWPIKAVTKWDSDPTGYRKEIEKLGMTEEEGPRVIYLEQEQIELSAVIVGANPNALARAYRACVISDDDLDWLSERCSLSAKGPGPTEAAAGLDHLAAANSGTTGTQNGSGSPPLPRASTIQRQTALLALSMRIRDIARRM